jgi:hypothetical protein
MKVTVLHYNDFAKAVYSLTSTGLLVGQCTAYIVVALYVHTKRFTEDQNKQL